MYAVTRMSCPSRPSVHVCLSLCLSTPSPLPIKLTESSRISRRRFEGQGEATTLPGTDTTNTCRRLAVTCIMSLLLTINVYSYLLHYIPVFLLQASGTWKPAKSRARRWRTVQTLEFTTRSCRSCCIYRESLTTICCISCCPAFLSRSLHCSYVSLSLSIFFHLCTINTPVFFFLCNFHFYRSMHFSAERGLAIACRLSVCLWRWWFVIT